MNNCHDAFGLLFPKLVYTLKVEHPELLLGDECQRRGGPEDGLAAMWSGLDFAHERLRADRLWWIDNTARQYDLEGVDLNFLRIPFYFKLGARKDDGSRTIPARIGDGVAGAHRDGKLRDVVLRIETSGTVPGDSLGITMNDFPREVAECSRNNSVELALEPRSLRRGSTTSHSKSPGAAAPPGKRSPSRTFASTCGIGWDERLPSATWPDERWPTTFLVETSLTSCP